MNDRCLRTGIPKAACTCAGPHDVNIGGALNASAYALLAQTHRPSDPASLARAARELSDRGLTPEDIAHALRIGVEAVRALLHDTQATQQPTSPLPDADSRDEQSHSTRRADASGAQIPDGTTQEINHVVD